MKKSLTCPSYDKNDQDEKSQEEQLEWRSILENKQIFNTLERIIARQVYVNPIIIPMYSLGEEQQMETLWAL